MTQVVIPPWLDWARREVGVTELVGLRHNPRVVEYWPLGRVALNVSDDETPWCAAFVAAALEQSGQRSTRSGLARSYATSPHMTAIGGPRLGAICVLSSSRGPTSGHVGFVVAADADRVWLVGGNQNNAVNVAAFPVLRVIGWRQPSTWVFQLPEAPARPPAGSVLAGARDG
jgi:uncharacterized protein (TIGR02594 family)